MARFVLKFRKGEEVRWLGHLDLLRAFERVIRRAGVPIAYSQGFNPRAKMSFASALGVGVTGDEELLTLQMAGDVEPAELAKRMNSQMPAGLMIAEVAVVPEGGPKSPKVTGSEFLAGVNRGSGLTVEALRDAAEKLLAEKEIPVVRSKEGRTKSVNIRLSIESIEVKDGSHLSMRLRHGDGFTAKPGEVVQALAGYLPGLEIGRVHRVKMY